MKYSIIANRWIWLTPYYQSTCETVELRLKCSGNYMKNTVESKSFSFLTADYYLHSVSPRLNKIIVFLNSSIQTKENYFIYIKYK